MTRTLITGGSRGLGRALAHACAEAGHDLILTGRDEAALAAVARELTGGPGEIVVVAGDVADAAHRADLALTIGDGALDLLVNNASSLGPTPLRLMTEAGPAALRRVFDVNVAAPAALVGLLLPALTRAQRGVVVNISSDAATSAYEGWGPYGISKAAFDHATAVMAVEHPGIVFHAVDPGDMNTAMHLAAVPDADRTELADPADVAPVILDLVRCRRPGGRTSVAALRAAGLVGSSSA